MRKDIINAISYISLMLMFFNFSYRVVAQDMENVKATISTLCSKEFAGRGYSNGGDSIAANFIVNNLKKSKLKSFSGGYFQKFTIPVNTFPGEMKLAINDSLLTPGYDYLVSATSNSIKGDFPVLVMNHNLVDYPDKFNKITKKSIAQSFLLIDTLNVKNKGFKDSAKEVVDYNMLGAKGIIEVTYKNLMHVPSQIVQPFPRILIQKNSLPDSIYSISLSIENKYNSHYPTRNIAAFIPGKIDTFIVFSAHYDHLGEMGKGIFFPGANDNASGTTMLLELAKYFAKNKKKLKYSIAFIFYSAEEMGLLGSFYYAQNPVFPLSKIKFLTNLDMVGSGDKGIKVVNGTEHKTEFDKLVMLNNEKNYLPEIGIRGPAANSDHFPLHQKGVKCFFIYTLGEYSEYHSIYDEPKALPLSKFKELFNLMVDFTMSFN
jgi:aminopeptidase YwaD